MNHVRYEVTVRFRDLDALGHVNYAVYLSYIEDALNVLWCEALQAVGQRFDATKPGIVSVRVEIDYRASALCGQTLGVGVWVSRIGNTSFTAAYRIFDKHTGKLLVEANTTQVVTIKGEEEGRMPEQVRAILQAYSAAERIGP
jgi:acyl-CoA thioester hydrolase